MKDASKPRWKTRLRSARSARRSDSKSLHWTLAVFSVLCGTLLSQASSSEGSDPSTGPPPVQHSPLLLELAPPPSPSPQPLFFWIMTPREHVERINSLLDSEVRIDSPERAPRLQLHLQTPSAGAPEVHSNPTGPSQLEAAETLQGSLTQEQRQVLDSYSYQITPLRGVQSGFASDIEAAPVTRIQLTGSGNAHRARRRNLRTRPTASQEQLALAFYAGGDRTQDLSGLRAITSGAVEFEHDRIELQTGVGLQAFLPGGFGLENLLQRGLNPFGIARELTNGWLFSQRIAVRLIEVDRSGRLPLDLETIARVQVEQSSQNANEPRVSGWIGLQLSH